MTTNGLETRVVPEEHRRLGSCENASPGAGENYPEAFLLFSV